VLTHSPLIRAVSPETVVFYHDDRKLTLKGERHYEKLPESSRPQGRVFRSLSPDGGRGRRSHLRSGGIRTEPSSDPALHPSAGENERRAFGDRESRCLDRI